MLKFLRVSCFLVLFLPCALQAGTGILPPRTTENTPVSEGRLNFGLLVKLVADETNKFRATRGLPSLIISQTLGKAAQDHAEAMTRHGFFAHVNPYDADQRDLTDRMQRVGLQPQAYAENIAMNFSRDFGPIQAWSKKGRRGQSPGIAEQTYRTFARNLVQQWIASSGHRKNMLGRDFSEIGLGFSSLQNGHDYATIYCVQTFSSSGSRYVRQVRYPSLWN